MLSGRCYERESVPYKALDSLIDSLARYLKGLPTDEVASRCCRQDVGFLARAFPVLQSLEAIARRGGSRPMRCPTSKSCGGGPSPDCASS